MTKSKPYLVLILFIAIGCTHHKAVIRESGSLSIRHKIHRVIQKSGLTTNLGLKVVNLRTGETLYEYNPDVLFHPASNNKLYTSIATLAKIDTGFTFKTAVYKSGNNIFLTGSGDPDFSLKALDSLASIIAQKILYIDTLYIDDTIYDAVHYGEGWMWDEGAWWYAAPIGGLSLNDNCVDFYIHPGTNGNPPIVTTNPKSKYYSIVNDAITVNDTAGFTQLKIGRNWAGRTNEYFITGMVLDTASADTLYRNIYEPALFAGTVFMEMLSSKQVSVNTMQKGIHPVDSEQIAYHESGPLIESLSNLMKESDNLTAESLVKLIGHQSTGGQGTWENGLLEIKLFLNDVVGIDTTALRLADGSGVSRYNYSSPNHLIHLLTWAYHNNYIREQLITTLPRGGWDGTLKDRLNGEKGNNVFAKTGTLSGVSCLSGYILPKNGDPLVFSILMNGYVGSSKPYRNLQDSLTSILME